MIFHHINVPYVFSLLKLLLGMPSDESFYIVTLHNQGCIFMIFQHINVSHVLRLLSVEAPFGHALKRKFLSLLPKLCLLPFGSMWLQFTCE